MEIKVKELREEWNNDVLVLHEINTFKDYIRHHWLVYVTRVGKSGEGETLDSAISALGHPQPDLHQPRT